MSKTVSYPLQPRTRRLSSLDIPFAKQLLYWTSRFSGGFILWLLAITFGLLALKGNMRGFASSQWLYETGAVYLLWGFLNYLIFFTLAAFLIPVALRTRKYKRMILSTFLVILAVGFIKYYFVSLDRFEYVRVSYFKDDPAHTPVYYTLREYLQKTLFTGLFVSSLAYAWGLTYNWVKTEKQRTELEEKQVQAELAFLKMQLNPHFLFNSLNSIYSLAIKKSDTTPDAVLKLSEMMRYVLYEKEDETHKVPLKQEVEYLENFIGFQRIRFNNDYHIDFTVSGEVENKKVASLILIPFVENAFKHGVITDAENPLAISMLIDGNQLIFKVKNKKEKGYKDQTGGIGLENTRKRLALLYPGRHELIQNDSDLFYYTQLTLQL